MVKLRQEDIKTKEVLSWKGIHLFHFTFSSCSMKTRIFMGLKNIDYTGHHINLQKKENFSPYFQGITPRSLVPVLVDDGEVHICLLYTSPSPRDSGQSRMPSSA